MTGLVLHSDHRKGTGKLVKVKKQNKNKTDVPFQSVSYTTLMFDYSHFFKSLFILRERARSRARVGRGREQGEERIPSRFCPGSDVGLDPWNREIMT